MNVRQFACALIMAGISLGSLVACAQSDQPPSAASAAPSCEAPGMSNVIERALCSGNPSNLQDALFKDAATPFEPGHRELLAALQRVWNADGSYGKDLPWEALKSPRNRAIVAEYLAQGIRNKEIEGSLEDLQQFAVAFVREAKTDTEQLDGLRLLGITDARDQVPMLRSVARATEGPPIRREYAIDALGKICAPEAEIALREIKQTVSPDGSEARRLAAALSGREGLARSWCRGPETLPSPGSESVSR